MFETTVIPLRPETAYRGVRFFTLSIAAHSIVVIGAIAVSIANVEFPTMAPDELSRAPLITQVQIPPPLGIADGGAAARPAPQERKPEPPPRREQETAPAVTPEEVPQLDAPRTTATGPAAIPGEGGTGSQPGPVGEPWGEEGSLGPVGGPPATSTSPPAEERIYEVNEVKPPRIIHRVDPPYPHMLVRTRMRATVIVRCVIDREGRVRDVQFVRPAMPPFNAAVLEAMQEWRFTPGMLGERRVETYMTLTVNFDVK